MLDSRARLAPVTMPCGRAPATGRQVFSHGRGEPLERGRSPAMQEPPTPITSQAATRGRRFLRTNGGTSVQEPPPGVWSAQPGVAPPPPPRRKPKLKKLRLAFILLGISLLAVVSTVFGMLMAVASDLPSLENRAEYRAARNSVLYSDGPGCRRPGNVDCQIATLAGNQNRILLEEGEISPNIKNAVIAIEDRRFYEHEGVDYTGIARALVQDVHEAPRGAGRLDDHAAVREERARRPGQPLGVPEIARVGARISPRAPVVEGQDPHPIPEHGLFRERRLRHRGRGAHLLRRRRRARGAAGRPDLGSAVRHADAARRGGGPERPPRERRDARRGRAARRDDLLAEPVRPAGEPAERAPPPQPRAPAHVRAAPDHPHAVRGVDPPGDPGRGRGRSARLRVGAAVLHELDDAAARRPLRPGARLRRRHEDQDDDRP